MTRTTSWLSLILPLSIPLLRPAVVEASELKWDMDQVPIKGKFDETACPDYASYATYPQ